MAKMLTQNAFRKKKFIIKKRSEENLLNGRNFTPKYIPKKFSEMVKILTQSSFKRKPCEWSKFCIEKLSEENLVNGQYFELKIDSEKNHQKWSKF